MVWETQYWHWTDGRTEVLKQYRALYASNYMTCAASICPCSVASLKHTMLPSGESMKIISENSL